ncbi:hypothetical protein AVEN_24337-1 [Araneus ventricosus]|uniref:Uncharacterized protein n=1 Tax=Araneus ventricosus TaxID=182803 RepID=A0A4Y2SNF7_ARAVE|nr:hypothetical protein AVEN_24337-1 [Araneus ventricosus]
MVTSRLALTCCKLVSHLHTCRDKFAESLQTCSANLLQKNCYLGQCLGSKGRNGVCGQAHKHQKRKERGAINAYYEEFLLPPLMGMGRWSYMGYPTRVKQFKVQIQ